jgi:two-component system response regulator NreC
MCQIEENKDMSIRVVIADDHTITRQGLRSLLEHKEGFEVVGEAANGREVLTCVRDVQPDIVVMDVTMPELNGVEATRRIIEESTHCKIVTLSMHASTDVVSDMLRAGASAYVLKDCAFQELDEAIRVVAEGGKYLSPRVAGTVIDDYVGQGNTHDSGHALLKLLSPQEREVLQLVAEGKSGKEIAIALHKSNKAIEATRCRIMNKLDARSVAELVRVAIISGLTPLEL